MTEGGDKLKASFSKLTCFKRCRKLFKYQYKDRLKPKQEKSSLKLGKTVHEVLESFYKMKGGV